MASKSDEYIVIGGLLFILGSLIILAAKILAWAGVI